MPAVRADEGRDSSGRPSRVRSARAILEGTCPECWQLWLKQQTMLINHYGLNVMDPQARQFLTRNMEAFLFKAGQEDEVDTSKQGTISH